MPQERWVAGAREMILDGFSNEIPAVCLTPNLKTEHFKATKSLGVYDLHVSSTGSSLCHLLAVLSWAYNLTSLCFSFLNQQEDHNSTYFMVVRVEKVNRFKTHKSHYLLFIIIICMSSPWLQILCKTTAWPCSVSKQMVISPLIGFFILLFFP